MSAALHLNGLAYEDCSMCDRHAEIWDAAIEAAAKVAAREWGEKPIVAPLTNAAYDEAARTIESGIRALKSTVTPRNQASS